MAAFVMIQIGNAGDLNALHMALHAVAGVKTVHFLAGPTDVLALIEGEDLSALTATVAQIRAVPGVASTDTRVVLPL